MALLKTTLPSPDWIHDAVFNLSPPFICLSTGALSMSGYFFFVIGSNFFTLNNEPLPHLNAPVCPSLFPSLLWRLFLSQVFAAPEKLQRYGELFHLHQSLSASICISQVTAGPPSNTSKAKLASNPLHPLPFFSSQSFLFAEDECETSGGGAAEAAQAGSAGFE